jgi:hypothetical protein
LALAKKRADVYGLTDRITFYHADVEKLSDYVPIKTYDLIYSFGVIHHTPHPGSAIKQIKKYMDKNTLLKIMVYNRMSLKALMILLTYGKGRFWDFDKYIADHSEAQTGCPVTYSYTKNSIKKLLKGFRIIDSYYEHIFPYSIAEYKKWEYKKVWYFRFMPNSIFHGLEKLFGWHLCVTAQLER